MTSKSVVKVLAAAIVLAVIVAYVWAHERGRGAATDHDVRHRIDQAPLEPAAGAARKVKILRLFPLPMRETLALPGSVAAKEDIAIGCNSDGLVVWLGAREGDRVQAGQPLLRLDQSELQARLDEVRTRRDLAKTRLERIQALRGKDLTSREALDEAEADLAQQNAAVRAIEAALANSIVHAPIDGVLDRFPRKIGEFVHRGETVGRLIAIDQVKIIVHVPERDVLYLRIGAPVDISLLIEEELRLRGEITFLPLSTDAPTRTFPIEATVDNPDHLLRPGMIVKTALTRRQRDDALAAPFFAVLEGERGKSVFVEQNGVAQERAVTLGLIDGPMVELRDGVSEGDHLIVIGQRDLIHGERVAVAADVTDQARALAAQGAGPAELARVLR